MLYCYQLRNKESKTMTYKELQAKVKELKAQSKISADFKVNQKAEILQKEIDKTIARKRKIRKTKVSAKNKKPVQTKKQVAPKARTLKEKIAKPNSYVRGYEYFGCINSGRSATILHFKANEKSYYAVGREVDITDTLFDKNIAHIRYSIINDDIASEIKKGFVWLCKNGQIIRVYDSFTKAEKEYNRLNEQTRKHNLECQKEVATAKEVINQGKYDNKTLDAYLTLSSYGFC
jgi:hypothetical protein